MLELLATGHSHSGGWIYHQTVAPSVRLPVPEMDVSLLKPGLRLAVGLSGGADSVALLRLLAARASELGLVLSAAHLHHGLRGEEAEGDQEFCADLAASLDLGFHTHRVDVGAEAALHHESIEEAARRLRYAWFRELMASGIVDAVATAHTLDDQAETVLGKFLRGAWTEGLSGIHPVVNFPEGCILRPLLGASRSEIEIYLAGLGQQWREDSSNRDMVFTRNRLRHELLPELERWNPQIRKQLAQKAELARDEESWWQSEIARLAPQMLLTGRAVRGGGRAGSGDGGVALDAVRLGAQPPALQRRLLRDAASRLGVSLDFDGVESLLRLVTDGRAGQRLSLAGMLGAERTPREIRLSRNFGQAAKQSEEVQLPVPGEAIAFGWRFLTEAREASVPATIRSWKPGDRVTLRYSSGPRKIKEVLERLKITGTDRGQWPVVEWQGRIVWMQGVELQPIAELGISAEKL
jgi:tRNA(Ile)-lysidine synthase